MEDSKRKQKLPKRSEDFSGWYNELCLLADLADYAPVKGCMVIKPYGYAIWENIQKELDKMIKDTGHVNAYFPLFIPEGFLKKEKEHVKGFSPELAVVTIAGGKKLKEPLIVRPTSETIMYDMYAKWVNSYRDLPILINQWCNVVRWELRTRLFLRTSEFLWQEGHTAHATHKEAEEETLKILGLYKDLAENYLAIPVLDGPKSETEKFAGAKLTYAIEGLMQDGKALQMGTSHDLGQNFAKSFDIKYLDKDNKLQFVWQTSWGVSTRLVGALIMMHGDDSGLVLPPKIAPYEVVIVTIGKGDELKKVMTEVDKIKADLKDFRIEIDDREMSPGWKFTEWELKGVPIRLEIGPKDVAKKEVVLVRRDTGEKKSIKISELKKIVPEELEDMQKSLYEKAKKFRDDHTYEVKDYDEFKDKVKEGWVLIDWCGDAECEAKIKTDTTATMRCAPFSKKGALKKCVACGGEGKIKALFARAY